MGLRAGITDRFQFSLSYGSRRILSAMINCVGIPGFEANLKYMLIDESITMPGIAIGRTLAGFGNFNKVSINRYDMKAYGFILVQVRTKIHCTWVNMQGLVIILLKKRMVIKT